MRFIVDLYKLIIYFTLAVLIIGVVLFVAELVKMGGSNPALVGLSLYILVAVFVAVIVSLGILATFISIHDRHAEIADELREIRQHLCSETGTEG